MLTAFGIGLLIGLYVGWESHRTYLRKLYKLSLKIRKKLHGG